MAGSQNSLLLPPDGDRARNLPPAARPVTVSELVERCRRDIEAGWSGEVIVAGELSNLRRYPSGHVYFTLKDERAEVPCVMFASELRSRNRNELPANGDKVEAWARPTIYTVKGRFQLRVGKLAKRGLGDLHERFMRIKEKLRDEGWFASGRKRAPPKYPATVAVVVSLQGAAWRDVRKTLGGRYPQAEVRVFPAPAQGEGAAVRIAAAIAAANRHGCDVLLVCRGGGSLEDLWAYNELVVAEAVCSSEAPVITGIGHETDETIADYVADLRAATPTAAAVAAVPDRLELAALIGNCWHNLRGAAWHAVREAQLSADEAARDLRSAGGRLLSLSAVRLQGRAERLQSAARARVLAGRVALDRGRESLRLRLRELLGGSAVLAAHSGRLAAAARAGLERGGAELRAQEARLRSVDPERVLDRGFAMVKDSDGKILPTAASLAQGQDARIIFSDGSARAQIGNVELGR